MRNYPFLQQQSLTHNGFSIVPIRDEDKYTIMHMRNDQLFHLRQQLPLTKQKQDDYFAAIITSLFVQQQPKQVLFSFLQNDECIGYGGLVHINWVDKYAEISFIIKPSLEKELLDVSWQSFLDMIEQIAFAQMKLHKIFTYAFDMRPYLYPIIESCNFYKEAVLKEHCFFNDKFIDVVIHSKINNND